MSKLPQTTVDRNPDSEAVKAMYQAIGKFISNFSQLEAGLRWIVAAELGIFSNKEKETVLSLIDYAALCNAAQRMLLLQETSKRPTDEVIKKVIGDCIKMGGQRNIVAHGSWDVRKGAEHTNRQTLMPKFSFRTATELDCLAEQVWQLSIAVLDLYVLYLPEKG